MEVEKDYSCLSPSDNKQVLPLTICFISVIILKGFAVLRSERFIKPFQYLLFYYILKCKGNIQVKL